MVALRQLAVTIGLMVLGLALWFSMVVSAQVMVPPPQQGVDWVNESYTIQSPSYLVILPAGCGPQQPYNLYVFTQSQYNAWSSGSVTGAVYAGGLVDGVPTVIYLEPGSYVVVVYPAPSNYNGCLAIIGPRQGLGMGLVSLPSNPVVTNEVLGYFNITSISAYNVNASQYGVPPGGVSIQLNAVVVVQLASGVTQYYLVQGVLRLETQGNYYSVASIIWNGTSTPSVLSGVAGNGGVSVYGVDEVYEYSTSFNIYRTPFSGYLIINVEASGGSAVVSFGYVVIRSGSYEPPEVTWFDNVTISPGSPVISAFIEAYGGRLTGSGRPMSLELVLAGYGNGETTTLNALNARLALAYQAGSTWVTPPNIYDYSLNSMEAVTNVRVTMRGAFAVLGVGPLDPGLVNPQPPAPVLPMTYVVVYNPVTNTMNATYITQPYIANQSKVIYVGQGTRYVLTGYYVNGEFVNTTPVIKPGNWFLTYEVTASYKEQYLVSIVSPLPVGVNGTMTTNYTGWVDAGSQLSIEVSNVFLSNKTMLASSVGNETIIVNSPISLAITWAPYYLVSISSQLPITVNGTVTNNYTSWVEKGSALVITASDVVLSNSTMFKPLINNETIIVNSPVDLSVNWSRYYLVIVASPLPIIVNGVVTTNYTGWLSPGSLIRIAANNVTLGNGTMLKPSISNESIVVSSPVVMAVSWTPYYLVDITSKYPISINGSLTRNYVNYVRANSVIIVEVRSIPKYLGFVTLDPNASSLTLVVNKPVRLVITYTPNYTSLILLMILVVLAIAVMTVMRHWGGGDRGEFPSEEVQL